MRIAAQEPCRVIVAALYAQAQPGRTPRAAGSAFRVGVEDYRPACTTRLRIISESEVRWDKPDVSSGATHSSADLNGDGIPELAA